MNLAIVQGVVISKVACNNERREAAKRFNKPIEEVPLKYGSLRIAVNVIKMQGEVKNVSKAPQSEHIKEERLILEVSYRFDYKDNSTNIIKEHDVIEEIEVGDAVEVSLNHLFVSKQHNMKIINPYNGKAIRSYFVKCWADNITFFSPPELRPGVESISPVEVVRNVQPQFKEQEFRLKSRRQRVSKHNDIITA